MLIKYIKENIKQKYSCNGNKSLRNNYCINVTNSYRQAVANRKFNLSLQESLKDRVITQEIKDIIIKEWIKRGYKKTDITKIGILKALEILK